MLPYQDLHTTRVSLHLIQLAERPLGQLALSSDARQLPHDDVVYVAGLDFREKPLELIAGPTGAGCRLGEHVRLA